MSRSEELFSRASKLIPGGVNSPVRAFKSVGGNPLYFERGSGSLIYDCDGREYIDFCGSWGPLILGHARQEVVEAVQEAAENGLSFGTCNPLELEMAELVHSMIPFIEMMRMTSSGTEAVMTALRLARGFTGRPKIIKFDGCYHGHSDSMLVNAGSGLLTGGIPSSAGVTPDTASNTLTARYNDIGTVKALIEANPGAVAAVIVEPVAGNMGLIEPLPGFLQDLRCLCSDNGVLLIADEVITGFRFHPGAYCSLEEIRPDLITLGKIIGGGMPAAALGGRRDIMEKLAPCGPVYQAGTLSGNPVSLAAGIATLKLLAEENPYPRLEAHGKYIADEINGHCSSFCTCNYLGGVFTIFFTPSREIRNLQDVKHSDTSKYAEFFRSMLNEGFYLPPAQFEAAFVSAAHSEREIEFFVSKAVETIKRIG